MSFPNYPNNEKWIGNSKSQVRYIQPQTLNCSLAFLCRVKAPMSIFIMREGSSEGMSPDKDTLVEGK